MGGPGNLDWQAVAQTLVAEPVWDALEGWPRAAEVLAAPIDPDLADTADFCARYDVALGRLRELRDHRRTPRGRHVLRGLRRAGDDPGGREHRRAQAPRALVKRVLRADGGRRDPHRDGVRRHHADRACRRPWPVLVDRAVLDRDVVVIGSGLRRSKIALPADALAELANGGSHRRAGVRPAGMTRSTRGR